MANHDRRKRTNRTNKNTFLTSSGPVKGNVEINRGDLCFLDRVDGLRDKGTSTANEYVYPFSKISGATGTLASNKILAERNFFGVAAWHSDSGVTESLAIIFKGIFNMPIKSLKTTKVRNYVIPAGSGVTLYNQKVDISSSTTNYIGFVYNSGSFQSSVDFRINTILDELIL